MKVLVTGGSGFIGVNIVRKLLLENNDVVCLTRRKLDNATHQYLQINNGKLFVELADIGDINKLKNLLEKHEITHVIHAAAITPSAEEEKNNPERVMEINFNGTMNILNAARKTNVKKIIYMSSNGVYGNIASNKEIVQEDHALSPNSLYSVAKIASEMYCRKIQDLFGIRIIISRISSAYGPMERPSQSRNNMSLLYQIIHRAIMGEGLFVKGTGASRNWTHVYDIADAINALIISENLNHDLYNISFGKSYSITTILKTLKEIFPDFHYEFVTSAKKSTLDLSKMEKRGILDNTVLLKDTNLIPQYDLKQGIQQYISWLSNF